MITIFMVAGFYFVILATLYKITPHGKSLKDPKLGVIELLMRRKFTIGLVFILSIIHLVATEFSFYQLSNEKLKAFGFYYSHETGLNWSGLLISSFLHIDIIHLISNCMALTLLSGLEEGLKLKTYVSFLILGILGGYLSPLAYVGIPSVGISGGVFGILAAFIIRKTSRRHRDFLITILLVLGYIIYLVIESFQRATGVNNTLTDHFAHIGGAFMVIFVLWARKLRGQDLPF